MNAKYLPSRSGYAQRTDLRDSMNKSLNECLTSAIDATTRLAILNLEKDSLNARLGIVRKEIKSAKTLAWTTKRDYTDKYIQQTECQDDFFYTPNR